MAEGENFINRVIDHIATQLTSGQWQQLGKRLGLTENVLTELETQKNVQGHGLPFTVTKMLNRWMQQKNPRADEMVQLLTPELLVIGRTDIVNVIQRFHDEEVLKAIRHRQLSDYSLQK